MVLEISLSVFYTEESDFLLERNRKNFCDLKLKLGLSAGWLVPGEQG